MDLQWCSHCCCFIYKSVCGLVPAYLLSFMSLKMPVLDQSWEFLTLLSELTETFKNDCFRMITWSYIIKIFVIGEDFNQRF